MSEINSSSHTQSKFFYVPTIINSKKIDKICNFRVKKFPQIRIQFTEAAIFISMGDGSVPIFQEHIVCQYLPFDVWRTKHQFYQLFDCFRHMNNNTAWNTTS